MTDVVIIGGGIIGTMVARELVRYGYGVTVLEKNSDLALGATGANSGIIHAGHDPKPGTLKARFNLEGSRMWPGICDELYLDYWQTGALVAAASPAECEVLDRLERQARERNIPVERIGREQIVKREPHIADDVIEALSLPSTAVFTPWQAAIASMEEAVLNGAKLFLETEVCGLKGSVDADGRPYITVMTDKGDFCARSVINAAGVYADQIAVMAGSHDFSIRARKGEYFILGKMKEPIVSEVIYPVPSDKGKGILCTPTVHDNVLLGPNAQFVDNKEDVSTSDALNVVQAQLARTVKDIPWAKVIREFAGNRPTGSTGDFVIEEDKNMAGLIHVACIESPGLSSAPAIAEYVRKTWFANGKEKDGWVRRRPHIVFARLSDEEKERLVRENPLYGHMICRCEEISEAEIVDVIRRPCGARTVDGVKKRCRPGMGGCQSGFCAPEVVKILARELGVPASEILYKNRGSEVIKGKAKDMV